MKKMVLILIIGILFLVFANYKSETFSVVSNGNWKLYSDEVLEGNSVAVGYDVQMVVAPVTLTFPANKWSMISLPYQPVTPYPAVVFKDLYNKTNPPYCSNIIYTTAEECIGAGKSWLNDYVGIGNLHRYNSTAMGYGTYMSFTSGDFGRMQAGEGYWFWCGGELFPNGCTFSYNAYKFSSTPSDNYYCLYLDGNKVYGGTSSLNQVTAPVGLNHNLNAYEFYSTSPFSQALLNKDMISYTYDQGTISDAEKIRLVDSINDNWVSLNPQASIDFNLTTPTELKEVGVYVKADSANNICSPTSLTIYYYVDELEKYVLGNTCNYPEETSSEKWIECEVITPVNRFINIALRNTNPSCTSMNVGEINIYKYTQTTPVCDSDEASIVIPPGWSAIDANPNTFSFNVIPQSTSPPDITIINRNVEGVRSWLDANAIPAGQSVEWLTDCSTSSNPPEILNVCDGTRINVADLKPNEVHRLQFDIVGTSDDISTGETFILSIRKCPVGGCTR